MKISARDILKGRIKAVKLGAEIVSIITKDSADSLGLAPGKEVYAIIKASNVMIGAS